MRSRIDLERVTKIAMTEVQQRLTAIALVVQNEWKRTADQYLRASPGSTQEYKDAIVVDSPVGQSVSVVLRSSPQSPLPNILEKGLGPDGIGSAGQIDMGVWLLGGRSYRVIRFDESMASITEKVSQSLRIGENLYGQSTFKGNLASEQLKSIQVMMQALKPTRTNRQGTGRARVTKYGDSLPPGLMPKKMKHSTDILAGMYRMSNKRSGADSTFSNFRTITAKKPWIHPGIEARNILGKLAPKLGTIINGAKP